MKTIRVKVSTGVRGAELELTIEVPDDASEAYIDDRAWEAAMSEISVDWEKIEESEVQHG